jgi:SAM-dependent methyltransferase
MAPRQTLAAQADRHLLYQAAVQQPASDVQLFHRLYKARYQRAPLLLREDFCGTGLVSAAWVSSHRQRRAYGIDLDAEVLTWGALRTLQPLPDPVRSRVQLIQGDVLEVVTPKAHVIAAGNFSFCVFQTRALLLRYFRKVRKQLAHEGVFVLDVLGGSDTQIENREEVRRIRGGFRYVWEQQRFDPIQCRAEFAIHFRFKDGSELQNAFRYDWRMWSLPEVREALLEAGFGSVDVYWEGTDRRTGAGNGVFRRARSAPAERCWIACVVASP